MSAPNPSPGAALAERWRGKADVIHVGEDVHWVAVMRLPGCPPPAILLAPDERELEIRLSRQTEGWR